MTISDRFQNGPSGWTSFGGIFTHEGDHIRASDTPSPTFPTYYFIASDDYTGDLSQYWLGSLTYDLQVSGPPGTAGADVILIGNGGQTLVLDILTNPGVADYEEMRADFTADAGWRVGSGSGVLASEQQIRDILADVTSLRIRGEYITGADFANLDTVVVQEGPAPDPGGLEVFSDLGSDHDGFDGWGVSGDVQTLTLEEDGIEGTDASQGPWWYFEAPDKFEGDKSDYYNGRLIFRMNRDDKSDDGTDVADVIIQGANGVSLLIDIEPPISTQSYDLMLAPGHGWKIGSLTGPDATEADIRGVLDDITALSIRGEYTAGADRNELQLVSLRPDFEEPVLLYDRAEISIFDRLSLNRAYVSSEHSTLAQAMNAAVDGDAIFSSLSGIFTQSRVLVRAENMLIDVVSDIGDQFQLDDGIANADLLGQNTRADLRGNDLDNVLTRRAEGEILGFGGNDTLTSNADGATIEGGDGDDSISGQGASTLRGDRGNDTIEAIGDGTLIDGGRNDDLLSVNGDDATILGDQGDDVIQPSGGEDSSTRLLVLGGVGNDTIGGAVDSTLRGEAGNDVILTVERQSGTIDGGADNDSIEAAPYFDTVIGGTGNDTIRAFGSDVFINAGDGNDLVTFSEFSGAFLGNNPGIQGVSTVNGGDGKDTIEGSSEAQNVNGGKGADRISGFAGNDTIVGGAGADLVDGGADNDSLTGGAGADTLLAGTGDDTLVGGTNKDRLDGGEGNDSLRGGEGDDTLIGGDGADTLEGGNQNDRLLGGAGPGNLLEGQGGNDKLISDAEMDTLLGGTGDDTLTSNIGNIEMSGGAGADRFEFNGSGDDGTPDDSVITDFDIAEDTLVLNRDALPFGTTNVRLYIQDRAEVVASGVELRIGTDGQHALLLEGLTTLDGLQDAVTLIG